jgi:CrcB protein
VSVLVVVVTLVAGATGAVLRYGVSAAFSRMPARLPWAVFLVNVVGSFVGGVVLGLVQVGVISHDLRLILLTGFAGGLTTFSTLSVETIQLVMIGRWRSAVVSVAANVVVGVAALLLGCSVAFWLATP